MGGLSQYMRREWLSLILAAVVVTLGLNCVLGQRGLRDLLILREHRTRLERTRHELRADKAALETEVQNLRSDELYLQRRIRRELGFARQNELIYRFKSAQQPPAR